MNRFLILIILLSLLSGPLAANSVLRGFGKAAKEGTKKGVQVGTAAAPTKASKHITAFQKYLEDNNNKRPPMNDPVYRNLWNVKAGRISSTKEELVTAENLLSSQKAAAHIQAFKDYVNAYGERPSSRSSVYYNVLNIKTGAIFATPAQQAQAENILNADIKTLKGSKIAGSHIQAYKDYLKTNKGHHPPQGDPVYTNLWNVKSGRVAASQFQREEAQGLLDSNPKAKNNEKTAAAHIQAFKEYVNTYGKRPPSRSPVYYNVLNIKTGAIFATPAQRKEAAELLKIKKEKSPSK